jgi:hypothetical protein
MHIFMHIVHSQRLGIFYIYQMTAAAHSYTTLPIQSDKSTNYIKQWLPASWVRYMEEHSQEGGGSVRKPQLIPLKFQTNQVRKQFRLERNIPTWSEWIQTHKTSLFFAFAIVFFLIILYLKWTDARTRRLEAKKKQYTITKPQTTSSPFSSVISNGV